MGDVMSASNTDPIITHIHGLLEGKANGRYGLHDVTQRQHALQAAMFAEKDGHAAPLITASLLHDIGHLVHDLGENPAGRGVDDRHEQVGHDFLAQWFGPEVTEPVRLHVAAKRFLCATEADYLANYPPIPCSAWRCRAGRCRRPKPPPSAPCHTGRTPSGCAAMTRRRR